MKTNFITDDSLSFGLYLTMASWFASIHHPDLVGGIHSLILANHKTIHPLDSQYYKWDLKLLLVQQTFQNTWDTSVHSESRRNFDPIPNVSCIHPDDEWQWIFGGKVFPLGFRIEKDRKKSYRIFSHYSAIWIPRNFALLPVDPGFCIPTFNPKLFLTLVHVQPGTSSILPLRL